MIAGTYIAGTVRRALSLLALVALIGVAAPARADIGAFWRQQGEKPGPWMVNLKMGGAFTLNTYYYGDHPAFFALQLEGGYAVDKNRAAYLLLSPQFEALGYLNIFMLPFGFQYDIPLPVPGLYLTPRASAGFAAILYNGYRSQYSTSEVVGLFMPEFGVKYVLKGRLNFGADAFSLPIMFNGNGTLVQYRFLVYGGINL